MDIENEARGFFISKNGGTKIPKVPFKEREKMVVVEVCHGQKQFVNYLVAYLEVGSYRCIFNENRVTGS